MRPEDELTDFVSVLEKGAQELSLPLSKETIVNFSRYCEELMLWNRRIDLTALTTPADLAIKHFLDSLLPARFIKENAFVMDIGTGAGFPGIPIKVYRADTRVLLLDSSEKKITFLKHIIRTLKLKDITPIHQRAEDRGFQSIMKETIDVVISRAFAQFKDLFGVARRFPKQGGSIIGMLGSNWESALKEAEPTIKGEGYKIDTISHFTLPFGKGERTIVVLKRS